MKKAKGVFSIFHLKLKKETKSKMEIILLVSLMIKIVGIVYFILLLITTPTIEAVNYKTIYQTRMSESVKNIENTLESSQLSAENNLDFLKTLVKCKIKKQLLLQQTC